MSNTIYKIVSTRTGTLVDGEWATFEGALSYMELYLKANTTTPSYQIVPVTKAN